MRRFSASSGKKPSSSKTLNHRRYATSEVASPVCSVEIALRDYIDQYKRLKVIELFGTIDYDEDYDYKEQRAVG